MLAKSSTKTSSKSTGYGARASLEAKIWHVLRVETACEARVAKRIGEIGYPSYFPVSRQLMPRPHNQSAQVEVQRPAMSGYVFVALSFESPEFARFQPASAAEASGQQELFHSLGFLAIDGVPVAIKPEIIDDLREREKAGDFDMIAPDPTRRYLLPSWVRKGRGVRLVAGPFCGYPGTIVRTLNRRMIEVEIPIFGRVSRMVCR